MSKEKGVLSKGVVKPVKPGSRSIGTYFIAVLSLLSVSILWKEPILLAGVLLSLSIVMILIGKDQIRLRLYLWVTCGFAGALAEYIAIQGGAWDYTDHVDTIPIWLPLLWGIAAIFVYQHSQSGKLLKWFGL